jgi:hypothetical protein
MQSQQTHDDDDSPDGNDSHTNDNPDGDSSPNGDDEGRATRAMMTTTPMHAFFPPSLPLSSSSAGAGVGHAGLHGDTHDLAQAPSLVHLTQPPPRLSPTLPGSSRPPHPGPTLPWSPRLTPPRILPGPSRTPSLPLTPTSLVCHARPYPGPPLPHPGHLAPLGPLALPSLSLAAPPHLPLVVLPSPRPNLGRLTSPSLVASPHPLITSPHPSLIVLPRPTLFVLPHPTPPLVPRLTLPCCIAPPLLDRLASPLLGRFAPPLPSRLCPLSFPTSPLSPILVTSPHPSWLPRPPLLGRSSCPALSSLGCLASRSLVVSPHLPSHSLPAPPIASPFHPHLSLVVSPRPPWSSHPTHPLSCLVR